MVYNPLNTNDTGQFRVEAFRNRRSVSWDALAIVPPQQIAVKPVITDALTSKIWLIATNSVLSFCITSDGFSGALVVELSVNGGFGWFQAYTFPLSGEGIMDPYSDFPLAGHCARFTLFANAGFNSSGWLEVRSL